ncbi:MULTISPECIES: fascin domain-containing protein [unclassified Romboutsia]|uniref:fascin domain-containing protein n=1 Tax=unclassified Romboutsia TaxID=2626894 RepID=UPI000821B0F3|nr:MULTISPECIES: hypothetical protein [unclassified Romboutsia]SCH43007.1 Uncharacterised protein [uncultured Clostridium sp.]
MYRNRRDIGTQDLSNLPPTYFIELPKNIEEGNESLIVQIKSQYNNKYVGIGFDEYFYASEENPTTGKIFSFILLPNNEILIRLHGSRFLTVNENGHLIVDFSNEYPDVFRLDRIEDQVYSILAPNGKYLKLRDEDNRLVADEYNMSEKTGFKFRIVQYY